MRFDNWIPTLERAAAWNNWSEEEKLMQLAGHLRSKGLQEWGLMSPDEKKDYHTAVTTQRTRLDPGNKTLVALDFHHITQKENESVSDFIMRLERTFQIAFGHEYMSLDTRDVLLYGKLQDGLRIDLVSKAPAISGAQNYRELCIAAKNEERRLAELKRRKQYIRSEMPQQFTRSSEQPSGNTTRRKPRSQKQLRCYICNGLGHFAYECRLQKSESSGKVKNHPVSGTRIIWTQNGRKQPGNQTFTKISKFLFPADQPTQVPSIKSADLTSKSRHVKVKIEGIPITGIIDTGSDITIISGELFKNDVVAAQLSSEAFKPANKQACAYSGQPIALDGQMDVTISFESHDTRTTIYVKLQAPDQLLLSESVCRELGIVKYHSLVDSVESEVMEGSDLRQESSNNKSENTTAKVKMIRTVRIPANHAAVVPIQVVDKTDEIDETGLLLLEPNPVLGEALSIDNFLVQLHNGESTAITISNYSTTTHILNEGDEIGTVSRVNVVDSYATDQDLPDHSVMENVNNYSLIGAEV